MNKYQKIISFITGPIFALSILLAGGFLGFISVQKLNSNEKSEKTTVSSESLSQKDASAQQDISTQPNTSAQQDISTQPNTSAQQDISEGLVKGLGLIGAGIAFGLATLGAGVGIGNASSAAIGALSEKPSMFGISLVFVALCEGLVIFGFVIAAMIMGRI